jgi:CheY-like chemotaxis protein
VFLSARVLYAFSGTTGEPMISTDGATRHSDPHHDPRAASSAGTVLVVEDDEAIRRLGARTLRGAGYAVLEAGSATEALAAAGARAWHVDLLLTDLLLPGMSGAALAEQLTARHPGLRVVFISGYPPELLSERGLTPPAAAALLEKPYTGAELLVKVRAALEAPG